MFKVVLHKSPEEKSEYTTPVMQYAKRYADLYRDEYPYVEIISCDSGEEIVLETFGSRIP